MTTDPTPADEIRTAAARLRALLAAPELTAGPWLSMDNGDRLLRNQPGDEDDAPIYVVNEPMSNGANAAYIAAMHPGVGAALADWFDFEADLLDTAPHIAVQPRTERALAVARLINQEQP